MSAVAEDQISRIVSLVAELSRRAEGTDGEVAIGTLATRFGTTADQIRRDIATLTAASDESGADWLGSIRVLQEGDKLSVTSRGPFRRPVRLTALEVMAIQVGLAADGEAGAALAAKLADVLGAAPQDLGGAISLEHPSDREAVTLDAARRAIRERRALAIKYAGSADNVGHDRTIEPHEIVYDGGNYYVISWCREAGAWRRFRADRVLDAAVLEASFTPRPLPPEGSELVFASDGEAQEVAVRFSPVVARWVKEERPDARDEPDGGVVVTYQVADAEWLVRKVLSYAGEAAVVGPVEYRQHVRRVLTAR